MVGCTWVFIGIYIWYNVLKVRVKVCFQQILEFWKQPGVTWSQVGSTADDPLNGSVFCYELRHSRRRMYRSVVVVRNWWAISPQLSALAPKAWKGLSLPPHRLHDKQWTFRVQIQIRRYPWYLQWSLRVQVQSGRYHWCWKSGSLFFFSSWTSPFLVSFGWRFIINHL
jgi:hypothetical protein